MKEIRKIIKVGRVQFALQFRTKHSYMGRFGGGWNWNLGVKACRNDVIFNLLVFSIRINKARP